MIAPFSALFMEATHISLALDKVNGFGNPQLTNKERRIWPAHVRSLRNCNIREGCCVSGICLRGEVRRGWMRWYDANSVRSGVDVMPYSVFGMTKAVVGSAMYFGTLNITFRRCCDRTTKEECRI